MAKRSKTSGLGGKGQFLVEQEMRGKNHAGSRINPRPHFSQPDTGVQSKTGRHLDASLDVAGVPHRSSVPGNLRGGS